MVFAGRVVWCIRRMISWNGLDFSDLCCILCKREERKVREVSYSVKPSRLRYVGSAKPLDCRAYTYHTDACQRLSLLF